MIGSILMVLEGEKLFLFLSTRCSKTTSDFNFFALYIYCVGYRALLNALVHEWRSKDSPWELVLSFYRVCPRDVTQVTLCRLEPTGLAISSAPKRMSLGRFVDTVCQR